VEDPVAVLLEERDVERLLGGKVLVEELFCDAGGGGDVIQAGLGVAALGEQGRGGVLDQAPSLRLLQSASGRALRDKLTKGTLSC
jgi:hypothetical protein